MEHSRLGLVISCCAALACAACDNAADGGVSPEDMATLDVKDYIEGELHALADSAVAIQEAAPEPDADGWNDTDDADAVEAMRAAWADARDQYERVEGAIAVLFPELDASTDERYDGFIEEQADENPFDGEGVVGVHAIERILWSSDQPQHVIDFESALDGYVKAAFPKTKAEAEAFKTELVQRLIDDTEKMHDDFEPVALGSDSAFRGVIGSLQEQVEKVSLAAGAEDESRYSQRTLGDMRANLDGGRKTYAAFQSWVQEQAGEELDKKILAGFERIAAAYDAVDGTAIPAVPAGFNPESPSEAHLATPYGKLWSLLSDESDPENDDSLVSAMLEAADAIGIPQLPE